MHASALPRRERFTISRQFVLLNGFAILAVVLNHVTHWGLISMVSWGDQFGPYMSPFDRAVEAVAPPVLTVLAKLATFCVPAFLFTSGYFLAYIYHGQQHGKPWKVIFTRVLSLVIPYLIWSGVLFAVDAAQGNVYSPVMYVVRLFYGGAIAEYYFIPMLIQFYLISPWLAEWATDRWKQLLIGSAAIQVGVMAVCYLNVFVPLPLIGRLISGNHHWSLFPSWMFFFCFGLVLRYHQDQILGFFRNKKVFLVGMVVLWGAAAVLETQWANTRGVNWRDTPITLPTSIYACAVILTFLIMVRLPQSLTGFFARIGAKSYGIYLLHSLVLAKISYLLIYYVPWVFANQIVIFVLLLILGLGIPLSLMELVGATPARKIYRYLFA